ncbi:MAG: VOC family protein [Acidobacteria bacterium]|nr:VOC family protein [Acidobacteriota bacterium]
MGYATLTPYLAVHRADRLIEFLKAAFGGELTMRHDEPNGQVMHAEVRIGDSLIMTGDPSGSTYPETPAALYLSVENCDASYARAVAAGAITVHPPEDKPYGARIAWIKDEFGNHWYLAHPLEK